MSSEPTSGNENEQQFRGLVPINLPRGLHARASAKLVHLSHKLPCAVLLRRAQDAEEEYAEMSSILGLLMLGAANGAMVEVVCSGPEAELSFRRIARFLSAFEETADTL